MEIVCDQFERGAESFNEVLSSASFLSLTFETEVASTNEARSRNKAADRRYLSELANTGNANSI